ncbi:protein vein isoform X2 [Teleopsis dalmanni]|uniref:protein vein isoform X2 n=1 Tax=Teleopsis dalmanni TaxID=139649 RepID=UPI0018CFBD10|nr:protein vein isoform X2 [Teleopsis dalmanni]
MYARILRKWSLNTKLMSLLWFAVTMLLIIIYAPTATVAATSISMPMRVTAYAHTDLHNFQLQTKQSTTDTLPIAAVTTTTTITPTTTTRKTTINTTKRIIATYSEQRMPSVPIQTANATNNKSMAPFLAANLGNVGTIVESYKQTIAVDSSSQNSGSSSNNKNVAGDIYANRLINKLSSSSSSSSSSSFNLNSKNKFLNSIRTNNNNNNHQQQSQQHHQQLSQSQQQNQQNSDNIAYSYYYKPHVAHGSVIYSRNNVPQNMNDNGDIDEASTLDNENDNDDYDDSEESDNNSESNESMKQKMNVEEEIDDDIDETEDPTQENGSAGYVADHSITLQAQSNSYSQLKQQNKVPNFENSQIINLLNSLNSQNNYNNFKPQNQQTSYPASSNTRSTKTRRHTQGHSIFVQNYHSPVRENASVQSKLITALTPTPPTLPKPTAINLKNTTTKLIPFRYIIESYEIPASLPFTGELSEQQRRMLLHQQQLRHIRMLQQQAARSRRDSRAFGVVKNLPSSGGYQHFYNDQQPFQQLQQQPITRQHHNNNNNNNDNSNSNSNSRSGSNNFNLLHKHHTHQQQHQQHYRQRQRKQHARRYCSARDPAQLAFEAPTVFEGKIISMTSDRRANFSATVEVKQIFKQQIGCIMQQFLRLQFAYRNSSGECDIYREQLRARGLVRGDELEQGRIYLMFVQQIDSSNFTILGQPIRKTRRVVEAVKNAVSENYAQLASIRSITASNSTVENGKALRIVCKVSGRPPPKVTWFKDHKSINRYRNLYQFVHYKKRSELIIRSFNSSDAGRYECRAKNKVNRNLERRAIMIKAYPVARYDSPALDGTGNNCPDEASEFCFNGGTCKFFSDIGSYSCICPVGFIGERCDRKEVNNMPPNSTFKVGYIADDPNAYGK